MAVTDRDGTLKSFHLLRGTLFIVITINDVGIKLAHIFINFWHKPKAFFSAT